MVWWNEEVRKLEMVMHYPRFEVRGDLLYRIVKGVGEVEEVVQLLVPSGYQGTGGGLALDSPFPSHRQTTEPGQDRELTVIEVLLAMHI